MDRTRRGRPPWECGVVGVFGFHGKDRTPGVREGTGRGWDTLHPNTAISVRLRPDWDTPGTESKEKTFLCLLVKPERPESPHGYPSCSFVYRRGPYKDTGTPLQ